MMVSRSAVRCANQPFFRPEDRAPTHSRDTALRCHAYLWRSAPNNPLFIGLQAKPALVTYIYTAALKTRNLWTHCRSAVLCANQAVFRPEFRPEDRAPIASAVYHPFLDVDFPHYIHSCGSSRNKDIISNQHRQRIVASIRSWLLPVNPHRNGAQDAWQGLPPTPYIRGGSGEHHRAGNRGA